MKTFSVIRGSWLVSIAILAFAAIPNSSAEMSGDVFAPDRVIQVEVTMDPDDWHALRISHRTVGEDPSSFAQSQFDYYSGDVVIDGRKIESVGIRKKGFFGSVVSTRPSLKIRFDKYVDDQEFSGLDMMTLNNNNQDPTQAQQILSYGFLNAAGAVSPRCNLARVTVNGENLGIYTHLESIRKPFIKSRIGTSKGDLYEGYAGDFVEDRFSRIIHKWGKDDDLEELQKLYDVVQASDPIELEKLKALLDLDSFITLWAAEVLIGHWDGYAGNRNNWYAFRARNTGKFTFIPWGADSVFDDPGPFFSHPVPKSVKAKGVICQKLWELPEIRARYRTEMQRLLNAVWIEENMLATLARVQQFNIEQTQTRPGRVAAELARIRGFIGSRRAEIQAELDAPALDWKTPPSRGARPAGPPTLMDISGSFSATMQDGLPSREDENTLTFNFNLNVPVGEGKANLRYQIGDESHAPFNRYGVQAFPECPVIIRPGYPSIQIKAETDNGRPPWIITMVLDPHQLKPGGSELPSDRSTVWTVVTRGEFGSTNYQARYFGVVGTIKIDQFSDRPGSTISGSFELQAPAFKDAD